MKTRRETAAKRAGKSIAKVDPSRTAEYKLFISQPAEKPGDYPREGDAFYARTAPSRDLPAGVGLFSTGTTGAEGTLGGLLEQGRVVRQHFRRAFKMGTICSNDPVCAAHEPARDPTVRFLQGAACHGCLFIAEPACEQFNRFLDRALIFPTLGHEGAAFFRERP